MIGIDLVEIARIERLMGDAFYERVFTSDELAYIKSKHYSPATVAGLYAAKEAMAKALGSGIGNGVSFRMLEISHTQAGQPTAILHDTASTLLQQLGGNTMYLSISHTGVTAVAIATIRHGARFHQL